MQDKKKKTDRGDDLESENSFKTNDADSYNAVVDYFDQYTERFSRHLPAAMLELAEIPKYHIGWIGTFGKARHPENYLRTI